jgi:hypothetical protein
MLQHLIKTLESKMNSGQNINNLNADLNALQTAIQELKLLEAKSIAVQHLANKETILKDLNKAEFKVFSQWGDDGIIQFLIDYLAIEHHTFIEFGVENYLESNTRFLLVNNCWKGLVLDGSETNINQIKKSNLYWQYQLQAKCAFVNKDNINTLISEYSNQKELGILVIDVDGNDYWIWEAIDAVQPTIVIVEYNSLFGNERAITIPYQTNFRRTEAHYSNLFYGASLKALQVLATTKNYALVACNKNGNNAFFVRKDQLKGLQELSVKQAYKQASFRESRDQQGKLTYLNFDDALQVIKGLSVFNIESGQPEPF